MQELLNNSIMSEWLNDEYLDVKKNQKLKSLFANNEPFPHLVLNNFLKTDKAFDILNALKKGKLITINESGKRKLNEISFPGEKILDDYNNFLSSKEFILYLNFLTQTNILKKHGLFAYKYQNSDFFSCHHDDNEGRKITFILYLSDIEESDGGSLNLYSSEDSVPLGIEKRITSKFNKLVFFEGTKNNFHEVEKVIGNKVRYNIVCGFC